MVNFTCNTCGDSLKKKEVDMHFVRSAKCRQATSLTCFDCLKEFGQNYTTHTICITENQRYSANGLKGVEKTKIQVWSESIHAHFQSILASKTGSLTKSIVNLIEYLLTIPALPKKEKPFINLIRNVRKFSDTDARTVWNMVAEFQKQQQSQPIPDDIPEKNKNDSNGVAPTANGEKQTFKEKKKTELSEVPSEEAKLEDEGVSKQSKKKKKSKKAAESIQELEDLNITEELSTDLSKSKKNKKKREKSESAGTSESNCNDEDAVMEVEEQVADETKIDSENISKKEKKMRKKKEKFEAEMKALEAGKGNDEQLDKVEEPAVEGKKKKSKKHVFEIEENVESDKRKKTKRERTVSMAAESDQPSKKNKSKGNDENAEPNEEVQDAKVGRKEFNWADIIIQVLQSQDNHEMSIKRLCKKVVNEYLSSLLEGTHVDEVKATAKFQKKLYKTPGVFVHKDKAKLKSDD